MTSMAKAMAATAAFDTHAARAAALRQTRAKSNGEKLPMALSNRLADLAVKSWRATKSDFTPRQERDLISDDAVTCLALGRPVMVLRTSHQKLAEVRYIAKALRLAGRAVSSGGSEPKAAAAAKLLKLNFSYEDVLRHAKAFLSTKRRTELKTSTQRSIAPRSTFTTKCGFALTRVTTAACLADVAKKLGNCLATDRVRRKMAVEGMRKKCIAFFTLSCPNGNVIGLLETGKHGKRTWQAVEFKGKANGPVPVTAKSMSILLKKAEISVAHCTDLLDFGLADQLTDIVRSTDFAFGNAQMRIDVAPRAVRIIPGEGRPFLFELGRGTCRILGSNAFDAEYRAMGLLTATAEFWGPILESEGTFERATFTATPTEAPRKNA